MESENSELDILKIKSHKLEVENKQLQSEIELLKADLQVKYEDFDWSVIWEDEPKSTLPIADIIIGVLVIIDIIIILFK